MGAGKSSRPFRKKRSPGRETRGVQAQTRIPKSSVPRGREADAERDNRQNESKRARLDAQAEYMRQKSKTRREDRERPKRPNRGITESVMDARSGNRRNESESARLDAQGEYMRQKSETRREDREPGRQKRPSPNRRKAKRMAQRAQREKRRLQIAEREKRRKMEANQQSEYDRRKGF